MKVLLTGSAGFLGWHTRVRLQALTDHEVVAVSRDNWSRLPQLAQGVDAVIHLAGVNRGPPAEVECGNVDLARDLVDAISAAGAGTLVVYANSTQSGNDTPYGAGKARAGELLAGAAEAVGGSFTDVRLPNLFGEHARPHYNSFVATFVDAVIKNTTPTIEDRAVSLMHAQDASATLIAKLGSDPSLACVPPVETTVSSVFDRLNTLHEVYRGSDAPHLRSKFDGDLFNTLRASLFPSHYPMPLTAHADDRGRLVETVRAHGGASQTFVSTTRAGRTRGDHFHLHKVERFVVLSGQARISLRRLFLDEVVSFDVTGDRPVVVDMPTMWVHNITNVGLTDLTTLFWTDGLFDASASDTYWEKVC